MHPSPKSLFSFCSSFQKARYSGWSLALFIGFFSILPPSFEGSGPLRPGADHIIFLYLKEKMVHRLIGITLYYNIFGQGRRAASPASFPSRA